MNTHIYRGNILYTPDKNGFVSVPGGYIAVRNGKVSGISKTLPEEYAGIPVKDYGEKLIIPAFSDMHVHASQYAQRGTGMDKLLPDWLNTYTFPEECKFASLSYASPLYASFTDGLRKNGTFHSCIFATIHRDATLELAKAIENAGMCALVGKVNMDRSAPDFLCENTEKSIRDTEDFILGFGNFSNVRPIITPRFAPTCTNELLTGLGKLSRKYGIGVHTHLEESIWEADEAKRLFPDCSCDAEIYEKSGLLGNGPAVFAHFIFPAARDNEILRKYGALAVHCPDATANIIAGIMPVKKLLDAGISIALGSDVGSGPDLPVYRQISRAVQLSKLLTFFEPENGGILSFSEAFFMGTRAASAVFPGTGAFEPGCRFDALVLDIQDDPGSIKSPEEKLERFCYAGDDRNIVAGFCGGRKIL